MPTQQNPPAPTIVFFDGTCPLCSREMRLYMSRDLLHRLQWIDIAAPNFDAAPYGLQPDQLHKMMHVITPDGRIYTQVPAFVKIWEALPPTLFTTCLRGILKVPGIMPLAGILYRLFARNRHRLTGRCTPTSCRLPDKPD